jgi:hypothetical protein
MDRQAYTLQLTRPREFLAVIGAWIRAARQQSGSQAERTGLFQYDAGFLARGLPLSPFHLPGRPGAPFVVHIFSQD